MLEDNLSGRAQPLRQGSSAAGRDWRARLPFFYGWIVVAAAFLCLGLTYTVWYTFAVFYVALLEEFGWSRAASAGVFSLFVIVGGLAGAAAGALADRVGPGKVISLGVIGLAAGLLACSQINNLVQFYLFFGVLASVGLSATGWIPCVTLVNRWFSAKLGTALGITSAGIGAGILALVPFTQWLIGQYGWRTAYLSLSGIVLGGVLPVALLLMQSRPEDLGLRRDGLPPSQPTGATPQGSPAAKRTRVVDPKWASTPWRVNTAARTTRFWFLVTMMFMASLTTQMIFVHQVAFLVDGGIDKLLAASIVGLIGIISVGAKISWGWISDRLGREPTWTMGLSCSLVGICVLIATRSVGNLALVYLFALTFALGYGASAPLTPAIASDVFAGRNFGTIYGTLAIANGLGSAFGSWFAGYVFDITGSYIPAFVCAAATALVSIAAVWGAAPRKVRRVPGRS